MASVRTTLLAAIVALLGAGLYLTHTSLGALPARTGHAGLAGRLEAVEDGVLAQLKAHEARAREAGVGRSVNLPGARP